MAVHAAGSDDTTFGIDFALASGKLVAKRCNPAGDHADVGTEDIGCGCYRAVADHQIITGHGNTLRHREAARFAGLLRAPLEASEQRVELSDVIGIELRTRRPRCRAADGAAPAQDLLAHRKPKSRLLLVPQQRQIDIVEIFALLAL